MIENSKELVNCGQCNKRIPKGELKRIFCKWWCKPPASIDVCPDCYDKDNYQCNDCDEIERRLIDTYSK